VDAGEEKPLLRHRILGCRTRLQSTRRPEKQILELAWVHVIEWERRPGSNPVGSPRLQVSPAKLTPTGGRSSSHASPSYAQTKDSIVRPIGGIDASARNLGGPQAKKNETRWDDNPRREPTKCWPHTQQMLLAVYFWARTYCPYRARTPASTTLWRLLCDDLQLLSQSSGVRWQTKSPDVRPRTVDESAVLAVKRVDALVIHVYSGYYPRPDQRWAFVRGFRGRLPR